MAFDPDKYLNDSGGGFNPDKYLAGGGDAPAPKAKAVAAPPLPRDESAMPSYGSPTAPETSDTSQAGSDVGARLGARRMTDKTRSPVQVPTGNQLGKDYGSTAKATGAEIAKSVLGVASWLPRVPSSNSKLVRAAGDQAEKRLNSVEAQAGREYPESIPIAKGISTLASLYPFGKISEGVGIVGPKIAEGVAEYGPKVSNAIGRALPGAESRATGAISKIANPEDAEVLGKEINTKATKNLNDWWEKRKADATTDYEAAKKADMDKAPQIVSEYKAHLDSLGQKNQLGYETKTDVQKAVIQKSLKEIEKNPSTENLEIELRRLKEDAKRFASKYKGVKGNQSKALAEKLEQIIDSRAPSLKAARNNYEANSEPLDIFDSAYGKKGIANPENKQPSKLPSTYFTDRSTLENLRKITRDDAQVNLWAKKHIANELKGKDAKAARKWLDDQLWLKDQNKDIEAIRQQTEDYVRNLEKTASTKKALAWGGGLTGVLGTEQLLRKYLGF